jgi:CelD/BcsL family acetyltransferase involved in cellulose biosynthesis
MTSSVIKRKINFTIEPLPRLEALEKIWNELDEAGQHSFFLTWAWIGTWLRSLPFPPQTMLLRATEDCKTVGLSVITLKPTFRRGLPVKQAWLNATGDPAYDCITIEHNGFASAGVQEERLWGAFREWFVDSAPVNEFILNGIDAAPTILRGNSSVIERSEYGYRIPLAKQARLEKLMSSLSANSRQQLRRSIRAYERKGPLSIDVARDTQTALAFFAQMKALHVRSWTRRERRHAFDDSFFETFHRCLIRRGAVNGTVDLLRVTVGDRAVGYLYNFLHGGIVSNYQTGFDDADGKLRPGYVCHALAIAHYAAVGMSSYDFLGGTNRLKQSFGSERYKLCSYRLLKKASFFRAHVLARRRAVIGDDVFEIR